MRKRFSGTLTALDWWDVKLQAILDNKDSAKVLPFAR
jgi:hypothetical protein